MPEKNIDFGKFGASGIKGSEAASPADSTSSPATSPPR